MQDLNPSYISLRRDLLDLINGTEISVLDIGCATGINGKYLLDKNIANIVYGVEFNSMMAKEAEHNLSRVYCGDLNQNKFLEQVLHIPIEFDYIIFGDVLEHLIEPEKRLKALSSKLKNNGKMILSLPNVAHIEVFIQVFVYGTWPRNERGIFDKTHLKWFTKKDVYNMIEESNLQVLEYIPKYRARDAIGSSFNWWLKILRRLNKQWVTFQHIIVCTHAK